MGIKSGVTRIGRIDARVSHLADGPLLSDKLADPQAHFEDVTRRLWRFRGEPKGKVRKAKNLKAEPFL